MSTPTHRREIRADVHPNLTARVARMNRAAPRDIFAELLQNARRAGASRVRVMLSQRPLPTSPATYVTDVQVADDGCGIDDPAVLLAYGRNGWHGTVTTSEDAAGMGLACLSARGCSVTSRTPSQAAFHLVLTPACFAGEDSAFAESPGDDVLSTPSGTIVAFTFPEPADIIERALRLASRWYPIPVECRRGGDAPWEELPRQPFADPARTRASKERHLDLGVAFHLVEDAYARYRYRDVPDLNFKGIAVNAGLPWVEDAWRRSWRVLAEADSCKGVQLVLPARQQAVENHALTRLRKEAEAFMWRAVAGLATCENPDEAPVPGPFVATAEHRRRARACGVFLPVPPSQLMPWRPAAAHDDGDDPDALSTLARPAPRALIYDAAPNPPAEQALAVALSRLPEDQRPSLYAAARQFTGTSWYTAIPKIKTIRCVANFGDHRGEQPVARLPSTHPRYLTNGAKAVSAAILLETGRGDPHHPPHRISADLVFTGDAAKPSGLEFGDRPILCEGAQDRLKPERLIELMAQAYFTFHEDGDSRETQQEDFDQDAGRIAWGLLHGEDRALEGSLKAAAGRHLRRLLPEHRAATIEIGPQGRVRVVLQTP